MKIFAALALLFVTTVTFAGPPPYDDKADAKLAIKQALTAAAAANVPVIIVFGANWCPDCLSLDKAMRKGSSAPLLARNFKIVKVSMGKPLGKGQFDHNMDIAESYDAPLKKGIPTIVVVSPKNKVIYATYHGQLSDARYMRDKSIYDFFKHVAEPGVEKK